MVGLYGGRTLDDIEADAKQCASPPEYNWCGKPAVMLQLIGEIRGLTALVDRQSEIIRAKVEGLREALAAWKGWASRELMGDPEEQLARIAELEILLQ